MNVTYSLHAREEIKERKIEKVGVEETVKYPDKLTNKGTKYYAIKKLNDHRLKVVYIKEKFYKVITTYYLQ